MQQLLTAMVNIEPLPARFAAVGALTIVAMSGLVAVAGAGVALARLSGLF